MRPPVRTTTRRVRTVLLAMGAALGGSILAATSVGAVPASWARAFGGSPGNPDFAILVGTRLPRVCVAATVGAALGVAGAALQALLRNALASPDVIGVSGGASVGAIAALAVAPDASAVAVPLAGFGGALAAIALVVRLATVRGRLHPYSLLLTGVIVNSLCAATILFASCLAGPGRAFGILGWLSGSLEETRWPWIALAAGVTGGGTLVLWARARDLNLLSVGEESAVQLGVDVGRLRLQTFLAASLLVASAVSMSGIVGFVGLIVPHTLRLVLGPDHRLLVPASGVGGAIFLVWADAASRTLFAPVEIPVGVLTAFCGAPFFLVLLRRAQSGAP